MGPENGSQPVAAGQPRLDPAELLARLNLQRAQLDATIPTEEAFQVLLDAHRAAAVASREAAQRRLADLDDLIAEQEAKIEGP